MVNRNRQKRGNIKAIAIILAIIVFAVIFESHIPLSIAPIGITCSGNQTTWSACSIPYPQGYGANNISWADASDKGAILANGSLNTGIAIYFATSFSPSESQYLEKQLDLSSSDIELYKYGLVQGNDCNINIFYPANYSQPYASIIAIDQNNASIAVFNQCGGVGDLGTLANNYIRTQTPVALLSQSAALSISPSVVATNYTGMITIYGTGLMPGTQYNLVEASGGGSFTGLQTVTSSSAGTFSASFPATQVFNNGSRIYQFSLFNSNTGGITYATTDYTVTSSASANPANYTLNASSNSFGVMFITTPSGQDLCTTNCQLAESLKVPYGENLTLFVSPTNPSYKFVGWVGTGAGSYSGTNKSAEIRMLGNITETANFVLSVPSPVIPQNKPDILTGLKSFVSNILGGIWNFISKL